MSSSRSSSSPRPTNGSDDPPDRALWLGIGFILLMGMLFASLDAIAKYLSARYPVLQVVWARYVFQMMMVPFIVGRIDIRQTARTGNLPLQVLRSLFLLGATALFFAALVYIPLADATAIGFVAPLILTALSIPLLKEKVGARRWAAVIVGFVGVLVIVRPGLGVAHPAVVLPMLTALCFACYQITTRMLSTVDPPVTTFLYTGFVGAAVMTAVLPFVWVAPTVTDWVWMIAAGVLGGGGHFCLIKAYQRTSASLLAPFTYLTLIWTAILGYVVFGDFPDGPTIAGAAILVGSGLYVLYRESAVRRQARKALRRPG